MENTTTTNPNPPLPDYPRGVTFEQVWALLQETGLQMKENEKRWEETKKEMAKSSRQLNRQMGGLHRRFGELAEHLVAPNINRRFNELGYHFGAYSPGGQQIQDPQGKILTEIDLLLENGDTVMAIEVKTRPAVKDVEHHIRRLEILRDHRRSIKDGRKIQGAIAGAVFGSEEKKATIEAGLFVIEQSGDTMKINVPEGFTPREWF